MLTQSQAGSRTRSRSMTTTTPAMPRRLPHHVDHHTTSTTCHVHVHDHHVDHHATSTTPTSTTPRHVNHATPRQPRHATSTTATSTTPYNARIDHATSTTTPVTYVTHHISPLPMCPTMPNEPSTDTSKPHEEAGQTVNAAPPTSSTTPGHVIHIDVGDDDSPVTHIIDIDDAAPHHPRCRRRQPHQ